MDNHKIKNVIEATLLVAGRPVDLNELMRLFDEEDRPERKQVRELIEEMKAESEQRAFEIVQVASGYRMQVRQEYAEWVGRMSDRRSPRYSRALMETLALIAYRQPVTRGEIENVRGVTVSSNIVRTLLERGWVRIVGHRDVPGRPAMLGTTKEFLDYFNLKSLDELPSLVELKDIDTINVELDFDAPLAEVQALAVDGTSDENDSLLGEESDENSAEVDEGGDADMDSHGGVMLQDEVESEGESEADEDMEESATADGDIDEEEPQRTPAIG